MNHKFKKLLLVIGDVVILYASLYITLYIRYSQRPSLELWQQHLIPFSIIFIFWLIIFYISELYDFNFAINNRRFYRLSLRSFLAGGLISTLFFYLTPGININPKTNLLLFVINFAFLFIAWRHFFNWSLKAYLPKEIIAIIGYNPQVKILMKELIHKPHLGYTIPFVLIPDKTSDIEYPKKKNIPVYRDVNKLKEMIIKNRVSTLVLACDPIKSEKLSSVLFSCLSLKINFINLHHFYENITGKVPVDIINKLWFLENLSEGEKRIYEIIKRAFDVSFALLVLIVTFPLWIIFGIIIKIENKGEIIFKQERVGKNGKKFIIFKFRTMKKSNNSNPTENDDSRITRFGSLLRKSRLDELPQMLNVIKGNMSFVGIRPEQPVLVSKLEKQIPFYNERTLVKPGITGWDQVSGIYHSPSYEDTLEKLQYDLFYIKNRSFYLDLSIVLKTIKTVLSKSGR